MCHPPTTPAVLFLIYILCRYRGLPQQSLPLLPIRQSPFVTLQRTRPSRRLSSMHSTILVLLSMPVLRKRRQGGHGDSCALPRQVKRGASRLASSPTQSTCLKNISFSSSSYPRLTQSGRGARFARLVAAPRAVAAAQGDESDPTQGG